MRNKVEHNVANDINKQQLVHKNWLFHEWELNHILPAYRTVLSNTLPWPLQCLMTILTFINILSFFLSGTFFLWQPNHFQPFQLRYGQ